VNWTKRKVADLALFGGAPAFDRDLHVGAPNAGGLERFRELVAAALGRRWLTNRGPLVQALEGRLGEMLGVDHVVAVVNATVGIDVLGRALGLRGEVIVPAYTFVATAHALRWQGLRPVFCDVEPARHGIDPRVAAELVGPATGAILPVHLWGEPCETDALEALARRHGIPVAYDAAHAFGCAHRGRMIGGFGAAEVFSFHATKFFNTFEGGAITTSDAALARELRLLINFGFAGYDEVVRLGTNGKMHEISAAMGLANLVTMDDVVAGNLANYLRYQTALAEIPGLRLLPHGREDKRNHQYVVVEVDAERARVSRDVIADVLWAERVLARRYFRPGLHRMEPYRTEGARSSPLPVTERLAETVLVLPTGPAVGADDVDGVADLLGFTVAHGEEITARRPGSSA
jgi:dTDP-4-amino-4,6-dideoxygalactose transaminase